MKSCKVSNDKNKISKTLSSKATKSQVTKDLNAKNSIKDSFKDTKTKKLTSNSDEMQNDQLFNDRETAEMALKDFDSAFEKFWKSVTDGIDRQPCDPVKNTPIDNKISEIQKRIKLNQAILKNANEKIKKITFETERENFSHWQEDLAFKNTSAEELHRFRDIKALDLEIQKLRESKPDRKVFLKTSPGIVNFHETMESTLTMLDKLQNVVVLEDNDVNYRDIKNGLNINFLKEPKLFAGSDKE